MKNLLFVLALLCGSAFAQGSFYQLSPAYPNATLRVCPIGTANPCPSPSSIFSDAALSQGITQPVQLGPTGNFGFFVAAGQYLIQIGQPYNAGFVVSLGGGGGSGTVSVNNGSAGAVANYAAAGGSTTVGPDSLLTDNGTTLTYTGTGGLLGSTGPVASGANGGSAGVMKLFGSTSGSLTCTAPAVAGTTTNAMTCTNAIIVSGANGSSGFNFNANSGIGTSGANIQFNFGGTLLGAMSSGAGWLVATSNLGFNGGKGQHLVTQAANNDMAGVCTASAATTCTVTFTTAYTATPVCTATDVTGNTTVSKVTPSTTTLIITTAASSSDAIDYICIGSPN